MSIRVYMYHCRAVNGLQGGSCSRGIRLWAARHKFDYTKFLRDGLPVEVLEATGDAFALEACRIARDEAKIGRGQGESDGA